LMCDLWKNTLTTTVPPGAIPEQIQQVLEDWETSVREHRGHKADPGSPPNPRPQVAGDAPYPRQLKLYNSGSFFDPRAIPPEDHPAIARQAGRFDRVIVECHPALLNERAVRFRDQLGTTLEVAMGLETIHPEVLPRLNKKMSLAQFTAAAGFLQRHGIALRVFVLLKPPFLDSAESVEWAGRSIQYAFDCGAAAVSLIPTRFGNGALEALGTQGEFAPPTLDALETAFDQALAHQRGRVFVDLWDLEQFSSCAACLPARRGRLQRLNLQQSTEPPVPCSACDARTPDDEG